MSMIDYIHNIKRSMVDYIPYKNVYGRLYI